MATTVGKKLIYEFTEGDASMRDLLGGKGANLCEMARMGLPVPPGFVITTEACLAYYDLGRRFPDGLWEDVQVHVRRLEEATGKQFGGRENPLLVSVRSGAKFSMPGMMDTILNLGLTDETVEGLAAQTGNRRFALDAYRRFIQLFGKVVMGVPGDAFEHLLDEAKRRAGAATDADLSEADLAQVVEGFKGIVREQAGTVLPQDPWQQLHEAIRAVFDSWNNRRAVDYRNYHGIPHNLGTAVNVVTMVFGNMGPDSGTGVCFSRDPSTGANELYGEYLPNAQGEDVVAGIRTPKKVAHLAAEAPEIYRQLLDIAKSLERRYRDIQDIEFTIERGKLYILQTRNAKRTAPAAVKVAVDLAEEGLIDRQEAVLRVEPSDIVQLLLPRFDPQAKDEAVAQRRRIARGLNASPGAATGKAVFDADRAVALADRGEAVILVRPETNPDDVHGILRAGGVLTSRGGITSHAAVVTRGLGKPCIVGAEEIKVDLERRELRVEEVVIREGEEISIDGTTGEVFAGAIRTVMPELMENRELLTLLSWADGFRTLGVLANADYPTDAAQARALGAEGIGLCRTEHMFFETDRLPYVREMLINAPEATRLEEAVQDVRSRLEAAAYPNRPALEQELAAAERARDASPAVRRYSDALARLAEFQMDDFSGILEAMAGRPVVIRLLDMPLHEFLPNHDDLLRDVTRLRTAGGDEGELARKEEMLRLVESLREANPMLGHRGCRLGLTYPGVYEMQVRAIMAAACRLKQHGMDVRPEIMIPLVSHVNELKQLRARLEAVARETMEQMGVEVHYRFGTMIEVPRAALTAGEIAAEAEFFSFGSNDLTQMTFGFSRDDAEGKFLGFYREHGILANNPFQVLDRSGVGRLIRVATEEGRRTRPELTVGLCGEHGGDPSSIAFCQEAGLTYVSASPFRVPVARLAAAQVALGKKFEEVQREA